MCESKAYLRSPEGEKLVMDNIAHLRVLDNGVELVSIDGQKKVLQGVSIDEIDFIHHKLYLKK